MKKKLVIITGISGAGKNTALQVFENQGYFCTDNLPGLVVEDFLRIIEEKDIDKTAISIDIRSKHIFVDLKEFITMLNDKTILESEIIPSYLMSTAKTTNREVPIEDFMYWDVSVA